jgi:hypothetical protein
LSNLLEGLIGSKTEFSVPIISFVALPRQVKDQRENGQSMDLGIFVGIAMLVLWAIAALVFNGPGWVHLLLTVGVFVIIWRIVVRGDRRRPRT